MSYKCPVCGKLFHVLYPHLWSYKRDHKFMCTYGCLRAYDDRKGMNTDMALTKEQRASVLDMLIKGENPNDYIKSCGIKNPACTVWNMKQYLKKNDPETFAKIPTEPKKIEAPETVMLNGPVKIETPEGKTLARIDVPKVPAKIIEYKVTGISTAVGDFQYYKRNDYLDWSPIGNCNDTVSLKVEEWKELLKVLPEAAKVLGVNIDGR